MCFLFSQESIIPLYCWCIPTIPPPSPESASSQVCLVYCVGCSVLPSSMIWVVVAIFIVYDSYFVLFVRCIAATGSNLPA